MAPLNAGLGALQHQLTVFASTLFPDESVLTPFLHETQSLCETLCVWSSANRAVQDHLCGFFVEHAVIFASAVARVHDIVLMAARLGMPETLLLQQAVQFLAACLKLSEVLSRTDAALLQVAGGSLHLTATWCLPLMQHSRQYALSCFHSCTLKEARTRWCEAVLAGAERVTAGADASALWTAALTNVATVHAILHVGVEVCSNASAQRFACSSFRPAVFMSCVHVLSDPAATVDLVELAARGLACMAEHVNVDVETVRHVVRRIMALLCTQVGTPVTWNLLLNAVGEIQLCTGPTDTEKAQNTVCTACLFSECSFLACASGLVKSVVGFLEAAPVLTDPAVDPVLSVAEATLWVLFNVLVDARQMVAVLFAQGDDDASALLPHVVRLSQIATTMATESSAAGRWTSNSPWMKVLRESSLLLAWLVECATAFTMEEKTALKPSSTLLTLLRQLFVVLSLERATLGIKDQAAVAVALTSAAGMTHCFSGELSAVMDASPDIVAMARHMLERALETASLPQADKRRASNEVKDKLASCLEVVFQVELKKKKKIKAATVKTAMVPTAMVPTAMVPIEAQFSLDVLEWLDDEFFARV